MGSSVKKVYCIQSLISFAKRFILDLSHGYEYASDKAKQNPGGDTFKFSFIFELPCGETLLITNSIHMCL